MRGWLITLALFGCAKAGPDARDEVVASLAQDFALGQYARFTVAAQAMSEATTSLCSEPSQAKLDAARQAWWLARAPWKKVEVVQFGPTIAYPLRLGPKLDDWPARGDAVEALITGDGALSAEAFAQMGSATRGLPVVEYLLWPVEGDALATLADERRCEALVGASADVYASAALLESAWRDDWAGRVGSPDTATDDAYGTVQDVLDEWVNRMVFTVENVRATKLGKPLGDASGGAVQPDTIESRPSGRTLEDARDALHGVALVWSGDAELGSRGLRELIDEALAEQIDTVFALSEQRLAEVPETFEQSLYLEPEVIVRAQDALLPLQVALQVDLAQALGVTITFNDNDGD